MQKYELAVVLDGKSSPSKKKGVIAKIESLMKTFKGKVGSVEDWGEKKLAYPLGQVETGIFLFFPLELEPESAKNLNDKLRLEEDLLRFLLIKKE